MRGMITVHRNADLLEIVAALHATSGLAGRLHGRQKERHQDADDGNDDQKFDEGEACVRC